MRKFTRRPMNPNEGPSAPAYLAGHVLTEATPARSTSATRTNQVNFERTAHEQRQSVLLRLPVEVRQCIYDKVVTAAGLTQHIYVKDGRYTHTACVTHDHEGRDDRQIELEEIYPKEEKSYTSPLWSRRLLSSWANHWRCEEAAEDSTVLSPFLPLLLCCKRM